MPNERDFLTSPSAFRDVSRGNPNPRTLRGDDQVRARLTPETWRLEIVAEGGSRIATPRTIEAGNAVDLPELERLNQTRGRKFLKAMQCLNIAQPLGQGLWEGVPLRELLKSVGAIDQVRRVYYWGFHNNLPAQIFQSSLTYTQIMDAAPGELGPFVALRLNGEPISVERGGPVRMLVPWSHGFKSIKWLQKIVLTNEFRAMDTYANQNNDPESHLKTAAYIDDGDLRGQHGRPVTVTGTAMVGLPGLKRVEYWLRPDAGTQGVLAADDPAWRSAQWHPCVIQPAPAGNLLPHDIWGFDPATGRPKEWPLRYSWAIWSVTLNGLPSGVYEFRVRTVDQNDFAQPEPRPYPKSGRNAVMYKSITIT